MFILYPKPLRRWLPFLESYCKKLIQHTQQNWESLLASHISFSLFSCSNTLISSCLPCLLDWEWVHVPESSDRLCTGQPVATTFCLLASLNSSRTLLSVIETSPYELITGLVIGERAKERVAKFSRTQLKYFRELRVGRDHWIMYSGLYVMGH